MQDRLRAWAWKQYRRSSGLKYWLMRRFTKAGLLALVLTVMLVGLGADTTLAVAYQIATITGAALLVFRSRDPDSAGFRTPGHPVTTGIFVFACFAIVVATVATNLVNSLIGYAVLLLGIPACRFWQRQNRPA